MAREKVRVAARGAKAEAVENRAADNIAVIFIVQVGRGTVIASGGSMISLKNLLCRWM